MKLVEQLRSVMLSISHNKFRVFLTSLGIIIGTFTIIMVVGIGKASEKAVQDQYKRLSVESITISKARGGGGGGRSGGSVSTSKALTKDDALQMPDLLTHVKSVGISTRTSSEVAYGLTAETVNIQGINEAYASVTNLTPLSGSLFSDEDGLQRNKDVVLGYNLADLLFNGDVKNAVGQKILLKGTTFTVTGVLNRIGGSGGISSGGGGGMANSSSADDMAFIPYEVAVKYTSGKGGGKGGGGQLTFIAQANDIDSVKPAIEEIKQYIGEKTGDPESYSVVDAGSTLSSAQQTANTMSALLIAVAAIVMIVSGIGIMNVLMVAVKERTREIGILKSIGAARKVILVEFLLEAVFISLCGGLLGVFLSVFAPWVLSFSDIKYLASWQGVLLGIGFSVMTGIFFGYYPAAKASKLKPIEALNYD